MAATTSFCQSQHRKHYLLYFVVLLIMSLLTLLPGAAFLALFTNPYYQTSQNVWLEIILLGGGSGCCAACLYHLYHLLVPAKGALAKSIRKQQNLDDSVPVEALFQLVDVDLAQGYRRFGDVLIGAEWLLGASEAMLLQNLRGCFEEYHNSAKNNYSLLRVVDHCFHVQDSAFRNPDDLRAAANYICGLIPLAVNGSMRDYRAFIAKSEGEREEFLQKWEEQSRSIRPRPNPQEQSMIFVDKDGIPSTLTNWEDIRRQLGTLQPKQSIQLKPVEPVAAPFGVNLSLNCVRLPPAAQFLIAFPYWNEMNELWMRSRDFSLDSAEKLVKAYYDSCQLPDTTGWSLCHYEEDAPQEEHPPCSLIVDGTLFRHTDFPDVEASLNGLDQGRYHTFMVLLADAASHALHVSHGNGNECYLIELLYTDEKYTHSLGFQTSDRSQVLVWLTDLYKHQRLPDTSGWRHKQDKHKLSTPK